MGNCIFCKIIDSSIPCYKIYENKNIIVFLDISQSTKGHALIVPKKHFKNFLETPTNISNEIFSVAKKLGNIYIKSFHAKGVNILTNINEAAEQSVLHFHVHVIPRYGKNDEIKINFKENKVSDKDMKKLAKQISSKF